MNYHQRKIIRQQYSVGLSPSNEQSLHSAIVKFKDLTMDDYNIIVVQAGKCDCASMVEQDELLRTGFDWRYA